MRSVAAPGSLVSDRCSSSVLKPSRGILRRSAARHKGSRGATHVQEVCSCLKFDEAGNPQAFFQQGSGLRFERTQRPLHSWPRIQSASLHKVPTPSIHSHYVICSSPVFALSRARARRICLLHATRQRILFGSGWFRILAKSGRGSGSPLRHSRPGEIPHSGFTQP